MRFRACDTRRRLGDLARGIAPDDDRVSGAGFSGRTRGDRVCWRGASAVRHKSFVGEARDVSTRRGRDAARVFSVCEFRGEGPGSGCVRDSESGLVRTTAPNANSQSSRADDFPPCRFCLERKSLSKRGGELISPCACSGTQARVHVKCLLRWQATCRDGGGTCQVCHHLFRAPLRPLFAKVFDLRLAGAAPSDARFRSRC